MNKLKKILIVEDEVDYAEMVKMRLELAGYEVAIAEDAYQGNKAVINENYDLIILDLSMPIGGGFSLLERIRGMELKSSVPVVILTGKTIDDEIIQQAKQFNVSAIFTKPYDSEKFLGKIKSLAPTEEI